MAVGLIIGIGSPPTQEEFDYLLDRGGLPQEGFTYEALSLTAEEAADRAQLRDLYKAACVKQNWHAGLAFADDLSFTEVTDAGLLWTWPATGEVSARSTRSY